MGNALTNAGGLDGITGWSALGGASVAVAVDDTARGGPGRAAIVASGTAAAGSVVGLISYFVAAQAGQIFEAYGGYAASVGSWGQAIVWRTSGGTEISRTPIPQVAPPFMVARRGLPTSYARGYLRQAAPDGASQAALLVDVTPSADGAYAVAALKPYLAAAPSDPRPTRWDPGVHVNPDLQLPIWPSELPPFLSSGLATPIANAKAWAGDAGIPVRESLYLDLHQEFRGQMRLSLVQWDALDQFYADHQSGEFYVVRPDTDQLCVAEWLADGAPKPSSVSGPWIVAEVGLHLRVA